MFAAKTQNTIRRSSAAGGLKSTVPKKLQRKIHIQPKLKVGASNDHYEQEADRVADAVVSAPPATSAPAVQKKCAECEQKEQQAQRKPLAETITPLIQKQAEEKEEKAQAKFNPESIQRMSREEKKEEQMQKKPEALQLAEEEKKEETPVMKKEEAGSSSSVSSSVESRINQSKGSGSPLPESTRSHMESRFGADFSEVNIHTGSNAVQLSKELNAQAFTVGKDIYFNSGKFSPGTTQGKHLLAHELTHVVQQEGKNKKVVDADRNISRIYEKRIARWKIEGNTAIVDKEGDLLWELAKQVTGDGEDWGCIWPKDMKSSKAWDDHYERYLRIGDKFDISNLKIRNGISVTFVFDGQGDNYLEAVKALYGGENVFNLYQQIANSANDGNTPIQNLVIAGHTNGNSIWGQNANFSPAGLKPMEPKPTGAGAHNSQGPHRCWFTKNATVRIVGCSSQTVAKLFADVFLRRGAKAFGTNHWICGWNQTHPFPSRYITVEGPPCTWPPKAPGLNTAGAVNSAAGLWVEIPGRL